MGTQPTSMDKTNLLLAVQQVDNVLSLTQSNHYHDYMRRHLIAVRCELMRQIGGGK